MVLMHFVKNRARTMVLSEVGYSSLKITLGIFVPSLYIGNGDFINGGVVVRFTPVLDYPATGMYKKNMTHLR